MSSPDTLIDYLVSNFNRPNLRPVLRRAADALPVIDHRIWPYLGAVVSRGNAGQSADVITALAWAEFHSDYQVPRNGQLRLGEALRGATAGDENKRATLHTRLTRADPTTLGRAVIRAIEACRAAGQVPDWRALHSDLRRVLIFGEAHDVKRRWGADMYSTVPAARTAAPATAAAGAES